LFLLLFVFFFSVFLLQNKTTIYQDRPGTDARGKLLTWKRGHPRFSNTFSGGEGSGKKTRLFLAAFYTENEHHFTKTGSGQTQGNTLKKWSYCFLQVRVKSKLLRPEERLVKAGALARL
jgi:hypothetical protein